jgi:acid phosphatase
MGGRFILERFVCPAPADCWDNGPLYPNHVYCNPAKNETFVRININDGIVPIPGCADGPDESCSLESFVKRVEQRRRKIPSFADICGMPEGAPQTLTFLEQR